jgi:hypothetical protein
MDQADFIVSECEKTFAAENARGDKLTDKAEKHIAAVVIVIGLQLVTLNDLKIERGAAEVAYVVLALVAIGALGAALLSAVLSRRVSGYEGYPRNFDLIGHLESHTEPEAKLLMGRMYLDVFDNNARINDSRAGWLRWSEWLFVIGLLAAASGRFAALLLLPDEDPVGKLTVEVHLNDSDQKRIGEIIKTVAEIETPEEALLYLLRRPRSDPAFTRRGKIPTSKSPLDIGPGDPSRRVDDQWGDDTIQDFVRRSMGPQPDVRSSRHDGPGEGGEASGPGSSGDPGRETR